MPPTKLNIVISTKAYFPVLGGSVIYASMLAEAFVSAGNKVTVITRTPGPASSRSYRLIRQPSSFTKFLLAAEADILMQVESSWTDAWPFLLRKVPWICTVHRGNMPVSWTTPVKRIQLNLEKLAYKHAHTIGVSKYVSKSWNLKECPIPNPYNNHLFFLPDSDREKDIDIIFVGRMTLDKGCQILLDALEDLSKSGRAVRRVAFVGSGPLESELKNRADRISGTIEVLFPGRLDSQEVANWMRRSRILAFPTTPDWEEASPLTPLEAAACGCLVVAADSGGTAENVSPDHWIVKSGSTNDLARGLVKAFAHLANPISPRTIEFLGERSLDKVASIYLQRFHSLAGK